MAASSRRDAPARRGTDAGAASALGFATVGRPAADAVYEFIRDAVVDGRLAPGEKLVQEQLAGELGVSRTPVREALTVLTREGLVRAVHGSGYVVSDLSDQDIAEVSEVRERLETMALQQACGRLTPLQRVHVEAAIEEMAAADPADAGLHFELNRRFHQALIAPCGNHFLLTLIGQLWDHPVNRRITRSYIQGDEDVTTMVREHRDLLQASLDGDDAKLVGMATEHMRSGYRHALTAREGSMPQRPLP